MEAQNESPPIDTHAIASNALEQLTQSQEPTPAPASEPASAPAATPGETPAATTQQAAPASVSDAEQLLRDAGYVSEKKPDGRFHYIPRHKVVEMIESGLKKRAEAIEKERKTWETERGTLAQQAAEARSFRQLVEGDPKGLIAKLAEYDPRYKNFLQEHAVAQALPQEQDDPEPPPDIDLGNGRATYSLEGIRKLRAWDRRQLERSFEQRLAPYSARVKDEERRAAEERANVALEQRMTAQVTRAKTWPKWAENEQAILKVLQDDTRDSAAKGLPPQLSLHDAYMQVVPPALMTDYNAMRERVIKDLNGAPKSTSVPSTGAEPTRNPGVRTVEEIARAAHARLEGQGR